MASSSNPSLDASTQIQHLEYLYASTANVSSFVSVKLSSYRNYHLWSKQMLCLMESFNMEGMVDGTIISPQKKHDSLVKGWIFGSINEGLLGSVVDLSSAKEVWDKLISLYGPTMTNSQQDSAQAKTVIEEKDKVPIERKTFLEEIEIEEDDVVSIETKTEEINVVSLERETHKDACPVETKNKDKGVVPVETKGKGKDTSPVNPEKKDEETKIKARKKILRNKKLCKDIVEGYWSEVILILREDMNAVVEAINSDGNTMLHIAVGIGHNYIVREVLTILKSEHLHEIVNLDGSTALHIAAIVGNTDAAELLIKRNRILLEIQDHKGQTPLATAYENMHLDTIECLLKAANDDGKTKKKSSPLEDSPNPGVKIGVNLLVNAISAKQYELATHLVRKFPEFAVENDDVLMAIARTFPSGIHSVETLIYPIMEDNCEGIVNRARLVFRFLVRCYITIVNIGGDALKVMSVNAIVTFLVYIVILGPIALLIWIYYIIRLLISLVYFPFFTFYFLLWKVGTTVVPTIKHIVKKKKEWEDAKEVLKLVCDEIDKLDFPDAHPRYYTQPILEAARQNSYEVVDEILLRSPGAIRYKDKSGYDIIQLAVINRSEKIYNLIHIIGARKSVYRTIEDSSKNNMLHLAGRLAPSHKLKRRTGAALQLQRELQWREEVEKLVFPSYITKQNIFMETPDMVFRKEHENLVKEGEKWMKAVAESCSITATLITTIVFAAAITVPGGTNQETGIPLFTEDVAFTIFAISDAISLFASSTALLMFLSILIARFAEEDFLVSLPRRLIIGLCTLILSTTAMMVAFSATLFLVFCHRKPWMLAPICLLAFLPILSFGTLQIPLIVDLFRSTYGNVFGKERSKKINRFNPNDIKLFFGK